MDVSAVRTQIKTKALQKFYIFTGPEAHVMNVYISKITQVSNMQLNRIENISTIYNGRSKSILNINYCYVVRDDKDFMSYEKAWDNIEEALGNNKLILIVTQLDKRSKFYKRFKDQIVEFDYMKEDVLVKYIQKEIDLDENSCKRLIDICENDLSRIFLEVDKIKRYCGDKFDYVSGFEHLLKLGVIYQPPKDAVFDLVDAILKRNPKQIYALLEDCRNVGEANLVILSNLYRTTKHVLQIQSYKGNDLAKSTGLTGWEIKCAKNLTGHYNISELVHMMRIIREVEKGIKIGSIDDDMSVDYVLVNIL